MTDQALSLALPLAYGELSASDALELAMLKDCIARLTGFACASYKERCLRRRIAVRMRARAVHRYAGYAELLEADATERLKLMDVITINVSKFYRNPEVWRTLEALIVPRLFSARERTVRIWSAGCAGGEEPYTIAMMLKECALRAEPEQELARFDIVGSDLDAESLNFARAGQYSEFSMTDIADDVRQAWFVPPAFTQVRPEIRDLVRFEQRDLIKDDFEAGWHLIACRNVVIYLEREMQERLFAKFYEALAPGGVLVLGKVETLFGRTAGLFKPMAARERVFIKI